MISLAKTHFEILTELFKLSHPLIHLTLHQRLSFLRQSLLFVRDEISKSRDSISRWLLAREVSMHSWKQLYQLTLLAFVDAGVEEPSCSTIAAPSGALIATFGISALAAVLGGGDSGILRAPGGT